MSEKLVEAVARQLCKAHLYGTDWRNWADEARAAIALIRPVVLEEAAKVAEEAAANTAYPDDFISGYNGACEDCAAAIRALITPGSGS